MTAYYRTMQNASDTAVKMAKNANGAVVQLEQIPKVSKAGQVALKGLAMAGNMLAFAAIAKGIEILASAIDKNFINPAKYAKEAMQEAQEAIDETQNSLKNLSSTISENKKRFLELSQGVDKFSNNKTLSDDDYAEFLSISQEIAEVAPDLITNWDEQGNALLRLGENAKETGEILDDVLDTNKNKANETLIDNLPKIAKGIKYSVKEAKLEINDLEAELQHVQSNTTSSGMDILDSLKKDAGLVFDGSNYNKYGTKMEKALKHAGIDYTVNSDISGKTIMLEGEFTAESIEKAQKYFDDIVGISNKGYSAEELGLKKSIKEKERLIDSYYSQMTANLQAWVKENYQYQSLNSTNQTFINSLIPSLDWNKIIEDSGLESFSSYDYQNYITDKLITPLSTVTDEHKDDVNKAISKLLKFKDGDLEIVSFGEQVQREFDNADIDIDITPIFSDEKEAYNKLQNSLKKIATVSGKDAKESIESELEELGKGGTVNLTLRPKVDTSVLNEKGWDAGEGTATVFSSTYSNEDGTKAINFTPIIADPKTGEAIGVLSPEELTAYAEGVIAGTREDDLNLQIGAVYEGKDAIQQAEKDAMRVHELHEQYFTNDIGKTTKNNVLNLLKDFTKGFSEEEANRWEKVTLGSKSYSEATAKWLATLQTDYSSSIEKLDTSITSLTDNQELLNTALAEQAENGTISEETIASLKEKYSDLSKVLEITTNGVIINKDKLAELNAEEKKSIDKNLTSTKEKLVEQYNANSLAIAGYKMRLEDTNSITDKYKTQLETMLSIKEADQEKTKEQIAQLDLLGVEYDQLTSKTNKFLKSLSTADDGNIYDSVHSALEQVKEVYDEGDYGKDEFRNFVDYMSFEDLSTAPIEEVKDKYEDAMETAERYFTESNKGLKNFLTDTKKLGMATKDANGNWKLNIESVDKLAKKLGISSDAAQDILNKYKDKGWEINFTTTTDGLVDVETKLDKLEKKREKLEKKRLKLVDNKESTEEIDKQIDAVQKGIDGINEQIKLSIETDEAKTRIYEIQSQINSLSNTSVNAYVNKEQIEELKAQQKELAKEYNINLDAVLKVDTDKANEDIEETKEKSKEDTTFEIDAHTKAATDKIEEIFNKTYYLNVGVKNVTLENAKKKITNFLNGVTKKSEEKEESSGKTEANGTAITGKAYANGKRGKIAAGYSAKSLVGELGPEMRVRDGKYEVLGENGPEFTDVRPDDIIFNAKQTEEILKKGKVNARGNAYNTGANGGGPSLDSHTTSKKKKDEEEEKKKKSNSTDTTKFQEAIDWCSQSIENLSRTLDRLSSKLENTSSWDKQLKIQDKIIAQQKKLLKGYTKSSNVYKKEYTQSLNAINKKDRKKYKLKIESGAKFSIQDFSNEKTYNKIIAAQEAYNKWQDEVTKKKQAQYDLDQARLDKIQIKIDKQTSLIERDEAKLAAVSPSNYKERNKLIDKLIKEQKESYRLQIAMAKTDAERVKLQNELNTAIAEYKKQQFENIQTKYDNASNLNRTKQSRIQSQVDLKEAKGEQIGTAYYKSMIKYNDSNKNRLQKEETALQKSLNDAVKNGTITKYSQEWYDMASAIYEVQNSIDEMDKSTAEYNETLKELADTRFDNLIKQFDRLQSNMEFMGELLDYEELYDDDGNMTDEGIAKLGVLLSNLESKKVESDQIASRKSSLQDLLTQAKAKGATSLEFEDATYSIEQAEEKLAELNDTAQDSILDYKSLEKTIADYLEEGMQAQIDAYKELIDKKKEALEADQDLYEFQKKMKESTQDIVLLERQLAALEGDDSDEARKKRRQLEQQLKEAKESQSDDLRNRAIEMQKENLDKQAEQYEKDMKEKMEHISENLDEFIDTVNTNSGNILTVLKAIASQNGYELPEEIEKIFHEKDNAVSNPNSTDTTSNTKTVANNIITSEIEKGNKAETEATNDTANISKKINKVTKQEVDKTKALKQTVKEIMQRGTAKSIKKMNKKEKAAALKNETILNKYLIEKKSKKLSTSLQLELAKALGFNKLTKKTVVLDKNSKKIRNKLKKANIGYAHGGYINTVDLMDVAKTNGDDGWITAKNGEFMLTKVQSDNFLKLAKIAPEFVNATQAMMDNMNLATTTPPYISNTAQPQSIDNSVSIQVNGNPDKDALRQMEKIAQNIVDSNQKQIQRMAYNRGMRIR